MTDSVPGNYDEFVVVADDCWKISGKEKNLRGGWTMTNFSFNFAGMEWECTYSGRSHLKLECKEFAKGRTEDVLLELFVCDAVHTTMDGFPLRVTLTEDSKCWEKKLHQQMPYKFSFESVNLTIRILKHRTLLPDFTSANVQTGHLKHNCRLWVGGQVFHVNKELLCMHSPYFERMFNGNFKEANKDEVKLDTETADPALFQDFLLFLTFQGDGDQALPNRKNVAGLLQLAVFYQIDQLQKKCDNFLEKCHEMPVWERIRVTEKIGLKEWQHRFLDKFETVGEWKKFFCKYIDNE